MAKNCPNCGDKMPEEATFCLNCFNENIDEDGIGQPIINKSKKHFKNFYKSASFRRNTNIIAASLILALLLGFIGKFSVALKAADDNFISEGDIHNEAKAPENSDNIDGIFDTSPFSTDISETEQLPVGISDDNSEITPSSEASSSNSTPPTESVIIPKPEEKPTSNPGGGEKTTEPDKPTNPPEPEFDRFEYRPSDGTSKNYVEIIKYTGNASKVTVPAKIDGKYVNRIKQGAFSNNSKITEVTFVSDNAPYMFIEMKAFTNLQSLTTINMPDTDLGIYNDFADNCYSLKKINIDNNQYRFIDGGLYYWTSREWKLRYYCPAEQATELRTPSWCKGIESACNLEENKYLKRIYLHKDTTAFPSYDRLNHSLEAINVEEGCAKGFSQNGILHSKNSNSGYTIVYPPSNASKTYTMPENSIFYLFIDFENTNLETLYVPKTATLHASFLGFHKKFRKLSTVYIDKNNSQADTIKSQFTGDVFLY